MVLDQSSDNQSREAWTEPQLNKYFRVAVKTQANDLPGVIRSSQKDGMQDFTTNLCELVQNGSVDPKEAYHYAPNVEELKMALKGIRTSSSGIL